MTIAAGFRCRDGVLLLADSRHTIGDAGYQGQKIWGIDCGESGSSLLVTAAGTDSAILETVDFLKSDAGIRGNSLSFETVTNAIRRCNPGKNSTLLVGVKLRNEEQARLLRVEEDDEGKIRINQLPHTFTGAQVAEALCREIFEWLYSPSVRVLQMKELAKHVFGRVFDYDPWCGPPVQSDYLFDDGGAIEMIGDFRMPTYTQGYRGYLCGVQHLLGATIRGCIDFTTGEGDFENVLQQLIDELKEMRKNSKGRWLEID